MKLVIDRSKWYRGLSGDGSRLRRQDGQQCCLGFLGTACGVEETGLLDVQYPVGAGSFSSERQSALWPKWLFADPSEEGKRCGAIDNATHLAIVNDSIGQADREQTITRIFAEHGVEVEFVDGPVSP